METKLIDFIHTRHIDSFQKVRVLLFLYQHPDLEGDSQQLAQRLYFDVPLVEKIIKDLQAVGLIDGVKDLYALHHEPELELCLAKLAETFEDPLARQELFDQVSGRPAFYKPPARRYGICRC